MWTFQWPFDTFIMRYRVFQMKLTLSILLNSHFFLGHFLPVADRSTAGLWLNRFSCSSYRSLTSLQPCRIWLLNRARLSWGIFFRSLSFQTFHTCVWLFTSVCDFSHLCVTFHTCVWKLSKFCRRSMKTVFLVVTLQNWG